MLSLFGFAAIVTTSFSGCHDIAGRPVGTREAPIHYGIPARPLVSDLVSASVPSGGCPGYGIDAAGPTVSLEWKNWVFGTGIGAAGMQIADLDGDGSNEIVASAATGGFGPCRFWYCVEQEAGSYRMGWSSDVYTTDITCLTVADYNLDGRPDVCVASGGVIFVYDGVTKQLIQSVATAAGTAIRGLNYSNVDGDPAPEFVFVNSSDLFVYSSAGVLEERKFGYGGVDCVVGNIYPDRTPEIIIANTPGYILNGRTRSVIESYPQGFGRRVELADQNGDGIDDLLISMQDWYYVNAFMPGISRTPVWQVNTGMDMSALTVSDVNGDGPEEVLIGQGQFGSILAYNSIDGTLKWAIPNPDSGVTWIAVGNLDVDSQNEVAFGAGYASTGPDYLSVFDGQSRTLEWKSTDLTGGPFVALDYGNLDLDSDLEYGFACMWSKSGYGNGRWFVHNAVTKILEYVSPEQPSATLVRQWRLVHANVDADPQPEICVVTSQSYDGCVICYDGLTHAEQYRTANLYGESIHGMVIKNVDGDPHPELVVSTYKEHTGASGVHILIYDATTGVLEWQSPSLSNGWGRLDLLRVENVDLDPNLEIIVGDTNEGLTVIDAMTHFGQVVTGTLSITALATADVNSDGVADIVVGDGAGKVVALDPYTGNETQLLGNFGARIDGLVLKDVAGDPGLDLVFCQNGSLKIAYKDSGPNWQIWSSPFIANSAGAFDSVVVADIDADGRQEVFMGDGVMGVRIYEIER